MSIWKFYSRKSGNSHWDLNVHTIRTYVYECAASVTTDIIIYIICVKKKVTGKSHSFIFLLINITAVVNSRIYGPFPTVKVIIDIKHYVILLLLYKTWSWYNLKEEKCVITSYTKPYYTRHAHFKYWF